MYTYIRNYPSDREMGWSEELQGVCHDKNNWFFTQNGNLWKFPVQHDLNNSCSRAVPSKGILKLSTSFHLGDLDHYNGYLYVATTGSGKLPSKICSDPSIYPLDLTQEAANLKKDEPRILVFRASDLAYVRSIQMRRTDGNTFDSLGWLAINPKNGLLYTSDHTISNKYSKDSAPLHVYKIGSMANKEVLTYHSRLVLFDEFTKLLVLSCMQGGCFDNDNYLHLMCGFVSNYKGKDPGLKNLDTYRDGINVFKVNEKITKGSTEVAYRLSHSNQSKGFRYQFDSWGNEPEGLTYWDLDLAPGSTTKTKSGCSPSPGINGQLHAIMLDNLGSGADDFYFKHYARSSFSEFYHIIITMGDLDGAGTDGDVYITFNGNGRTSGQIYLDSPIDDFERATTNHFIVEVNADLGTINQVTLTRKKKDKMYVKDVTIFPLSNPSKKVTFTFNKWI